ncbi:hypothetical protein PHISP_05780 [Aspergillus sp. HF37]|nr:hypothetical protein PHISP_05780 [Aspergillus sp. HF37]
MQSQPQSQSQSSNPTPTYTRNHGDNVPAIIRRPASLADPHPKKETDDAVEYKSQRARAQAGAHAGPVGTAEGPGHPGLVEETVSAADMSRKRAEHARVLGEQSLAGSGGERELGTQRRLEQDMETG